MPSGLHDVAERGDGVLSAITRGDLLLLQLDDHLLDFAGEGVVPFLVVFGHRCSVVDADVGCFVGGEDEALSPFDLSLGDFLAVDEKSSDASLPQPTPFVGEVETERGLAGGDYDSGLIWLAVTKPMERGLENAAFRSQSARFAPANRPKKH